MQYIVLRQEQEKIKKAFFSFSFLPKNKVYNIVNKVYHSAI